MANDEDARSITIEITSGIEPDGYYDLCNMLWMVLHSGGHTFTITPDDSADVDAMDERWDAYGEEYRWNP
jgi:hypothetical protein